MGILASDDSYLWVHLMPFKHNQLATALNGAGARILLLGHKVKGWNGRKEEEEQPEASPSQRCPSSETRKPGGQTIHVKEPSVLVHVPWGHVVGSAHSLMSAVSKTQHRLLRRCRTAQKKKTPFLDGKAMTNSSFRLNDMQ